jgi:hypothetical protein
MNEHDDGLSELGKQLPHHRPDDATRAAVREALLAAAEREQVRSGGRWGIVLSAFGTGALAAAAAMILVLGGRGESGDDRRTVTALAHAQIETSSAADFEREVLPASGNASELEIVRVKAGKLRIAADPHTRVATGDAVVEGEADYEVVVANDVIRQVHVRTGKVALKLTGQHAVFLAAGDEWKAPISVAIVEQGETWSAPSVVDGRKADGQKADSQKVDGLKVDGLKADGLKVDGLKADSQKADSLKADSQKADSQKVDGPKADGQKVDSQKADSQKVDGSPQNIRPPETRRSDVLPPGVPPALVRSPDDRGLDRPTTSGRKTDDQHGDIEAPDDKHLSGSTTVVSPEAAPQQVAQKATEAHFQAGWRLLKAGKNAEAARELGVAAEAGGELAADARYFQAVALTRARRTTEAEQALVAFLDHAPSSLRRGRAELMLGRLIAERGDSKAARLWLETATHDADPDIVAAAHAALAALR